ncbi:uncharacterized protein BO97DRAFT_476725 [Aspergillus homomorphus CBS 101889]|uniref:Uncharacterized protein n=1 Tax=Aspergillus homomorphus (strain CBS 101889) TaxID=1450537 RepID=A0A395I2M9_ASPHC|nr:hypothetical protein BO97DRAFT_476725 [Aspergillus homomorphus CBS 101889]RAL14432.1 hypothetical protein BO97DRAFT_476725 [Aspergillus homomorphus CBS 101889]
MDFLTKDLLLKKRTSFSFLFGSNRPTFALHNESPEDQPPGYYDVPPKKENKPAAPQMASEEDEDTLHSTRQELSSELEAQVRYACSLLVYRIEQGISSNYSPNRAKAVAAARRKRVSAVTATSTISGCDTAAAAQIETKYLLSSTTKKLRDGVMGRLGGGIFARDGGISIDGEKHDSGVGLTQQPSIATMREGQRSKLGSSHSNYTAAQPLESVTAGNLDKEATEAIVGGEHSMIVSPISPTAPEGEEDVIISPITVSTTTTTIANTTGSGSTVYRTVPTSLSPTDSSNHATSSEDTNPTSSREPNQHQHRSEFLTRGAAATGEETTQCRRDQDTAVFLSPTDPAPDRQAHSATADENPDLTNDSDVEVFLDPETAAEYITSSAGGVGGVGISLLTTSTPSLGLTIDPASARQSRVYIPPAPATINIDAGANPTATEEDASKIKRKLTYTPTYPSQLPQLQNLTTMTTDQTEGEDEPPIIIDTNGNAHVMNRDEELERDRGLQQAVMTKMQTGSIFLVSPTEDTPEEAVGSSSSDEAHESNHGAITNPARGDADAEAETPGPLPRLPEPTYTPLPPRRPGTSASRLKTSWSAISRSTASVSGKLRRKFRRGGDAGIDDDDDDDDDDSFVELERSRPRSRSQAKTPTLLFKRLAGWLTGRGSSKTAAAAAENEDVPTTSGLEGVVPYQGT